MTIPIEIVILIGSIILALIGVIYGIYVSKVNALETKLDKFITKTENDFVRQIKDIDSNTAKKLLEIQNNLTNAINTVHADADNKYTSQHEDILDLYDKHHAFEKEITKTTHDIELSVTEFGSIYLTRNEYNQTKNGKT